MPILPRVRVRFTLLALVLAALVAPAGAGASAFTDALGRHLSQAGGYSGATVVDLDTGRTVFDARGSTPRMPASVEKLETTSTALLRFGAGGRLSTTVVSGGDLGDDGAWHGNLYLVGGGDPTFGTAHFNRVSYGAGTNVETLAAKVKAALGVKRIVGRVFGDESWLDSRRGTAPYGFQPSFEIGGILTGLAFDRGFYYENGSAMQRHPALFAAGKLTDALKAAGVRVTGKPVAGHAPPDALEIARVQSPPMRTLVALTLPHSDNWFAEMLLKDLGAAYGSGGSTAAGAAVVRAQLAKFGIRPTVVDGSGLSRSDRVTPRQIVQLLVRVRTLAGFRAALPVAGESGTLQTRMRHTAAQGACEGKTGTLHDASALAGYCRSASGHLLAYAILVNYCNVNKARAAQDRMAVDMARWRGVGTPAPTPTPTPTPAPTPSSGGGASRSGSAAPLSSSSRPGSSSTATPRRSAFSSFDPGLSPATT